MNRNAIPLQIIWIVAILARLILLGTNPSLSDDVYRYIWDGHLLHQNINPYAEPVNSVQLDAFTTTLRENVNHPEMASPYLPVAQAYFWLIEWLAPQQVKAFQVGAVVLDLLTALLIQKLLTRLQLKPASVLLYLWNPLVIIEFAHGAHVDALMVFLIMLAWYAFLTERKKGSVSALILALATLTKGLPAILVPLWLRKWQVKGLIIYLS